VGQVEAVTERAWHASLAATGLALTRPGRLDRAPAALAAGLPKAAHGEREAFAACLGHALATRGVLVIDRAALRRLDRIDTVMVDAALLATDPLAAHLRETAAGAGLKLEVADRADPAAHVRELQAGGAVVCTVAAGDHPLHAAADCAVGLTGHGRRAPWRADLVARDSLADAALVCDACAAARRASRHGAWLTTGGSVIAGLFVFGGRVPGATARALTAVNATGLAALLEGARLATELPAHARPQPGDPTPWHQLPVADALTRVGSGVDGLTAADAAHRHHPPPPPPTLASRYTRAALESLTNPFTPLLVAGAGLSLAAGSLADAVMVTCVVGVNSVVDSVQTVRNERAVAALDDGGAHPVTVRRDGAVDQIDAEDVVVGDIISVRAGDAVPADCRLVTADALEVDESALTGESMLVAKSAEPTDAAAVADRTCMLYEATSVAAGEAEAVVVATGGATEARRAVALAGEPPASGVDKRLASLTRVTAPVTVASGVAVIVAGLLRRQPATELVGSGVGLAVAAVPEGLPVLSTLAQIAAARRLARRGALVANPRAVEALGRVDVLCADKTGTLTEGDIRLARVSDARHDADLDALDAGLRRVLVTALRASPACAGEGALAHPTDQALVDGGAHAGVADGDGASGWTRLAELPFEPARGFHAVLGEHGDGQRVAVKGAPEVLVPRCTARRGPRGGRQPLDDAGRRELGDEVDRLARQGLRVLAVAERSLDADGLAETDVAHLCFVGFVALNDPVRPTAAAAVDELRRAGVDVVMITGDHPSTAQGTAAELGLLNDQPLVTGPMVEAASDAELAELASHTSVYARVTPLQKLRVVAALQRAGRAVAMAGDGANDAPAIRLADVGVALGTRATPAARDAADLTVVDDRIETVVDALEEGRAMWSSVRDAVAILFGGNLGEIGFTVGSGLVSGGAGLNPRQLLLVNLLTDIAPAMAIAVRPPSRARGADLLGEGPQASLGDALDDAVAWRATVTATGAFAAYTAARLTGTPARARTVALVALVGTQLGQTLVSGHHSPTVVAASLGSAGVMAAAVQTPGVSQLFGCQPLGPVGWATATTAATAATAGSLVAEPPFARAGAQVRPHAQRVAAEVTRRLSQRSHETGSIARPAGG
jgi:cation-transporting ATPase I